MPTPTRVEVLSTYSVNEQVCVREFFKNVVVNHLEKTHLNARLDFLAAHPANGQDGPIICSALQSLLEIPVSMSFDLVGTDVEVIRWLAEGTDKITPGALYFDMRKLKDNLRNPIQGTRSKKKDIKSEYEKIRTVGKGAFGTAVLYRRKSDEILVIIKEINMLELSASERQMALNEVNVLAMMDHPNIVSYMDSFERDSFLCIEMEYADGGNLAQFLTQKTKKVDEKEILMIFHQICSSIRYMHEQSILHR
ncbi:putative serine/threonine-protein kinase nek3 [Armadillidium vulgare]|nr:putative serine/threonine-protein kinase nek3 [Armadillidium vulgare]